MVTMYRIAKYLLASIFITYTPCLIAQKISGKITNGIGDTTINFLYTSKLASKEDSASVTDKGNFTKTFKFNEAKYLVIRYSNLTKEIYVFLEAKLKIRFDAADHTAFKNSFIVNGDYNINRYLDYITTNNVHYKFIRDRVKMEQSIDSFRRVLKDFRFFSDSLRRAFFPDAKLNKQIKPLKDFLITDSINWYSYSILTANDYVTIIPAGNKKLFRQEEIRKRLLFESSNTYLNSNWYRKLWFFFLKGEFENALKGGASTEAKESGFTNFAIEYINSEHLKGKLKDLIISQLLMDILNQYTYGSSMEVRHNDSLISKLKDMVSDKAFLKEFAQRYSDSKKVLLSHQIGKRAPDFSLTDTAGRKYTLDDFKDKIVLIDVWASWCKPCINEFPYLHRLQKKLGNNKQFQLLSISIDDTKQIWVKSGLLRFKPPGLALWTGKEKEFSRDYDINLIPVLILLDRKGNFIDFNPRRASDGDKLYELINEKFKSL